jgi:hypothetical protein
VDLPPSRVQLRQSARGFRAHGIRAAGWASGAERAEKLKLGKQKSRGEACGARRLILALPILLFLAPRFLNARRFQLFASWPVEQRALGLVLVGWTGVGPELFTFGGGLVSIVRTCLLALLAASHRAGFLLMRYKSNTG